MSMNPIYTYAMREKVYAWISDLGNPETRENALLELCRMRNVIPDLAPMLWYSFGTMAALLMEITSILEALIPHPLQTSASTLKTQQSYRVCSVLTLMECVALHPETRYHFLGARIPLHLFPFLHGGPNMKLNIPTLEMENLRLGTLKVLCALVKTNDEEVIIFLLSTEIIPLCLHIMENGSKLCKTDATFIVQKFLEDNTGFSYLGYTYDRFHHLSIVLGKIVIYLAKDPSARLLQHVVCCYWLLSNKANPDSLEFLRTSLPSQLCDDTFSACLQEDSVTRHLLAEVIMNLSRFPWRASARPAQQNPF